MRHNRGALLAWVVAGIPLVLSLLQAAAVGTADGILLLPGFYEVAVVTESGGVVVGLCLLAIGCWLGQGGSLFARKNRRAGLAFGAGVCGIVLLTFGLLSFSVAGGGEIAALGKAAIASLVAVGGVAGSLAMSPQLSLSDTISGSDRDGERSETSVADESERVSTGGPRSVDSGTLDRLERIAPDSVRRVREREPGFDEPTNDIETELYRGIEDAIVEGTLDPSVTSRYGQQYEIVNLSSRFREVELPMIDGRVHVREIEKQVRSWIEDGDTSLREIAYAIEAIVDHRSDIERYIEKREREFETLRAGVESDIDSIRSIVDGLEGTVGTRVRMLVAEDRHSEIDGISAIEAELAEAESTLHRCAFEEATQQLRGLRSKTDDLLTAVDFLRSLGGGIEHGQRTATVPNPTAERLYTEIEPLLEQEYDATLSIEGGHVSIETSGTEETSKPSHASSESAIDAVDTDRTTRDTVDPAQATDEILYTLRELKRARTSGNTLEYQTEQLPDGIASPELLEALAVFCRRQSDIVDEVTLQENAPPGFLEIRFTETTGEVSGVDELIDRFIDRHGSADS